MSDRIYGELAERYDRSSELGPPNADYDRPTILQLAGPVVRQHVLELGCASGHLTQQLVDCGAHVTALDRSEEMVRLARERLGERASIHLADLSTPLTMVADASVDVAVASLVLHYLPDWNPVLAEVRRCLRPGGALVMSIHHPITGWLRSDRSNYHRTELIEEEWDVDGIRVPAEMWRRPVSAVFSPLLAAGFVIDAVEEPVPHDDGREIRDPRMRRVLTTQPVFLYVRAVAAG
ncbi:hypothetical protein GCM10009844_12400 [Nocardioides koreensis]|uniref:Methyltransferase type 11 domain-containing protein n=1 Tax=Nocardioides koreensis TaxID=433651 RepID=A0ABP5LAX4_9ACTN